MMVSKGNVVDIPVTTSAGRWGEMSARRENNRQQKQCQVWVDSYPARGRSGKVMIHQALWGRRCKKGHLFSPGSTPAPSRTWEETMPQQDSKGKDRAALGGEAKSRVESGSLGRL